MGQRPSHGQFPPFSPLLTLFTLLLLQNHPFSRRLSLGDITSHPAAQKHGSHSTVFPLPQSPSVQPAHHQVLIVIYLVNISGTCASSPLLLISCNLPAQLHQPTHRSPTSSLSALSHPPLPIRVTFPRAISEHGVLLPHLTRIPHGTQCDIQMPNPAQPLLMTPYTSLLQPHNGEQLPSYLSSFLSPFSWS